MEGGGVVRRRITLSDRLSAADNGGEAVAGLTLEAVLGGLEKRSSAAAAAAMAPTSNRRVNRTLLDVIRDEEPHGGSLFGHKDKKSWKAFRDRIRLIRAGAAWTSSIHMPTSDMPIENRNNARSLGSGGFGNTSRSFMSRRNSARFTTVSSLNQGGLTQREDSGANISVSSSSISGMTRRSSSQLGPTTPISTDSSDEADENIHSVGEGPPSRSFRPQMVNPDSEDENEEPAREGGRHLATLLAQDRAISVREAVADQEAAEVEAATAAEAEGDGTDEGAEVSAEAQLVRMSLMDLLEETDWQMGLVGSKHTVGDMYDKKEEDGEEGGGGGGGSGGGLEPTCCVCMVRHKGAAFIPCGHTFCRLCSRELWAQRGNCPLCNGFIVEVLDIF